MSKNRFPAISVLMPVYNASPYLSLSINSILKQTFTDFEFIIIDDGSTDNSWTIIKRYARKDRRIIAVNNPANIKICKTLNIGIELARGKYIARMDADDSCYPDRLHKQYSFMESHPDVVLSGGAMEVCDTLMRTLGVRNYGLTDGAIRKNIFLYSPFCHATTIYRTCTARQVLYDEYLYDSEDYDFYFRMGKHGQLANLSDILYQMRINPKGVSLAHARRQEKLVLFIRIKAIVEYGYVMRSIDKFYFTVQLFALYIVPHSIKFFLFNLIRNRWRAGFTPKRVNVSAQMPFWGPISYLKVFLIKNAQKN